MHGVQPDMIAFHRGGAAEMPRLLPRPMFCLSVAMHVGLAIALLAVPAEKHVGTDDEAKVVSVELVVASRMPPKPAPAKAKPPEKKPAAVKKRKPTPRPDAPAENAPPALARPVEPVAPPPAAAAHTVGEAVLSSAASETRAEGRRAYGRLVWQRIAERKPAGIHLPGTAYVTFAVTASGEIGSISIGRSSGNAALDALALRSIGNAAPFDPPPAGLAPDDLVFEIPFNFR